MVWISARRPVFPRAWVAVTSGASRGVRPSISRSVRDVCPSVAPGCVGPILFAGLPVALVLTGLATMPDNALPTACPSVAPGCVGPILFAGLPVAPVLTGLATMPDNALPTAYPSVAPASVGPILFAVCPVALVLTGLATMPDNALPTVCPRVVIGCVVSTLCVVPLVAVAPMLFAMASANVFRIALRIATTARAVLIPSVVSPAACATTASATRPGSVSRPVRPTVARGCVAPIRFVVNPAAYA